MDNNSRTAKILSLALESNNDNSEETFSYENEMDIDLNLDILSLPIDIVNDGPIINDESNLNTIITSYNSCKEKENMGFEYESVFVSEIIEGITTEVKHTEEKKDIEEENKDTEEGDQDIAKENKNTDDDAGSICEPDTSELSDDENHVKITSRKLVKSRKEARNLGNSYKNKAGKIVKARKMAKLDPCRLKCKEKLNEDFRKKIFDDYWQKGSYDFRMQFISNTVLQKIKSLTKQKTVSKEKQKNRTFTYEYFFQINGKNEKVCKKCYRLTLGETNSFIEECLKKKQLSPDGVILPSDKRGSAPPNFKHSDETLNNVKNHILSFPQYESHYSRKRTSKQYLPSHLNLQIMYGLYQESSEYGENKVSRTKYGNIFHSLNLSFKKPQKDTCNYCDTMRMKIKIEKNNDIKDILNQELSQHQADADLAYEVKRTDKLYAKTNENHKTLIFDLQQCLPTPYLNTSVTFYKRQLWTFNLTIHDSSQQNETAFCYMWHESIAGRGGNQIASCLFKHLQNLPENVESVTFFSDTCAGQNKNSHVSAMFLCAIQNISHLKQIDHKFLIPGHTHMECDQDHSIIERKKKSTDFAIYHPYDWYRLVESCGKKTKFIVIKMEQEDFLDFESLLKGPLILRKTNEEGQKVNWHEIKWIRYDQDYGKIKYKEDLRTENFKILNLKRRFGRNREPKIFFPKKCYDEPVPISKEKKKDLLDLLSLVDPIFHDFYKNLPTDERRTVDPDFADQSSDED